MQKGLNVLIDFLFFSLYKNPTVISAAEILAASIQCIYNLAFLFSYHIVSVLITACQHMLMFSSKILII